MKKTNLLMLVLSGFVLQSATLIKATKRTADYSSFAIVSDSLPKCVTPYTFQFFFDVQVPSGDFTSNLQIISAVYPNFTPIETVKSLDTAWGGFSTAYAATLSGLQPGTSSVVSVFGNTEYGATDVPPWKVFWVVSTQTNGVSTVIEKENKILIYPNPVHTHATIKLYLWNHTVYHIYDANGREVLQFPATGEETEFLRGGLASGGYIIVGINDAINMKISQKMLLD